MDKPERYMTFVIISFILFLSLAVLSNYQGLSMLLYGSFACLGLVFLFFLASLRSMGQRDLFDVLGSLAHKTKGGVSRKEKASKEPTPKQSKTKPVKPSGSKTAEQEPSLYQVTYEKVPLPMPPPPPPPRPEGQLSPGELMCPMCGQKLHPLAAFCGRCGHKLREPDAAKGM